MSIGYENRRRVSMSVSADLISCLDQLFNLRLRQTSRDRKFNTLLDECDKCEDFSAPRSRAARSERDSNSSPYRLSGETSPSIPARSGL